MLVLALATPIVVSIGGGALYRPQALRPGRDEVAAAAHMVLAFGNSRFEASIDAPLLGERVGATARAFTGGGWDAVHYYQLALLSAPLLRPGRDVVLIEVSPLSLNDGDANNRLGVIRSETAWQIASLPGMPLESRLDVLLGAMAPVYRYRAEIQGGLAAPRLASLAHDVASRASWLGPAVELPAFSLITAQGNTSLIDRVDGDTAVFTRVNRARQESTLSRTRFGGFKLSALRRAVAVLRERGIDVVMVEVPMSAWMEERVRWAGLRAPFDAAVGAVAATTGAHVWQDWPPQFSDEGAFWDDEHMRASAGAAFTDALAKRMLASGLTGEAR